VLFVCARWMNRYLTRNGGIVISNRVGLYGADAGVAGQGAEHAWDRRRSHTHANALPWWGSGGRLSEWTHDWPADAGLVQVT